MKKKKLVIIITLIIILSTLTIMLFNNIKKNNKDNDLINEILDHYNKFVITNKETNLYDSDNNIVGLIGKNVELVLDNIDINTKTKIFKIKNFDEDYYIKYEDVDKIDKLSSTDDRYKNYIVFNKNIITKEKTSFYDENNNLVYEFNKSFDLPIIIKEEGKYGVEFNDKLLYIKEGTIKDNHNTDKKNSTGVGVLNYHAFYDEKNDNEVSDCVTEICHSKKQFKTHLDYLKENNILTLKMEELEKYIDGKIQLPKSVLITIDDGPKTNHAVDMLTEYKMYATIFLVTSWFNVDKYYKTEYIELHSHTHNLHDGGKCPGGQGGGLKCLPEDEILNDLKRSRELLNGSKALCYPFYEYNDYTIKLAKQAGFTMGFAGESTSGDNLVHVGDNKFKLKRFVIVTYTSLNDFDKYFGQIH